MPEEAGQKNMQVRLEDTLREAGQQETSHKRAEKIAARETEKMDLGEFERQAVEEAPQSSMTTCPNPVETPAEAQLGSVQEREGALAEYLDSCEIEQKQGNIDDLDLF